MSGFEFSWNKEESIVVRKQDAIAIYANPNGEIVIRQQQMPKELKVIWRADF